jgi:hypothetical protein
MGGVVPPLPNTPSWRGAQWEHRDNFTFYLTDAVSLNIRASVKIGRYPNRKLQNAALHR